MREERKSLSEGFGGRLGVSFPTSVFQREAGGPSRIPPSPTTLRPGSWSCAVVGAKREETCVCVWWVRRGSEEVGTESAALFVIGCCSPLLHTGSDKFRLVHLTQSCGHSESVSCFNQ